MNKTKRTYLKINLGLCVVLVAVAAGCVGYVDDGYDGGVVVQPDAPSGKTLALGLGIGIIRQLAVFAALVAVRAVRERRS